MANLATTVAADRATNNRPQQHVYRDNHARKVGFEGAFYTPNSGRASVVCAMGKGNLSRRHFGSFRYFLFSPRRALQVPAATVSQTHGLQCTNPVRAADSAMGADDSSVRVWAPPRAYSNASIQVTQSIHYSAKGARVSKPVTLKSHVRGVIWCQPLWAQLITCQTQGELPLRL